MIRGINLAGREIRLDIGEDGPDQAGLIHLKTANLKSINNDNALLGVIRSQLARMQLPQDIYMQKVAGGVEMIIKHKGLPAPRANEWPSAQKGGG